MKMPSATQQIIICCAVSLLTGVCARAADLNGAWANDLSICKKIFVKKNNAVSMTTDSDNYGSGFIIDGNRIRGKMATCNIKSRKDDGSLVQLITTCSTDVALQTVQFSLKIESENKITRVFPGVPEMAISYVRCPP